MKKLEFILIAGAVVGLLMSLFDVPLNSLIVSLSFMTLALIYFYLGFALFNNVRFRNIFKGGSFKGLGPWRIAIAIGTGIALSDLTVGFMFTILDYPMAKSLLSFGMVLTAIMLLLAAIRNAKEKDRFYRNIILRCAVFIIIGTVFLLLPEQLFPTT
jgi:putative Mn2+ efflux pump MntP